MRKETRCRHIGYTYRLTARVLLYAPSHRQDNTYHGLCYTSRGALADTRNSSMGPPHEGSIPRPIGTSELRPAPQSTTNCTISRKEGNTLFNDALTTFYLRFYGVRHRVKDQEGRKEMLYLTTHSPHFIYGFMALDIG